MAPFCTQNDHLPPWEGYATPEGTRLYSTMYPGAYSAAEHHFRRDPNMGSFHVGGASLRAHFGPRLGPRMPCAGRRVYSGVCACHAGQKMRGSPWLHLSSLGTGTYLGDEDDKTDAAVRRPLQPPHVFQQTPCSFPMQLLCS